MKILHLPNSNLLLNTGGKEVFVYQLVKNLILKGVQTCMLIHSDSNEKAYHYEGIPVDVLPPLNTSNYRKSYFTKEYNDDSHFKKYLKNVQPDIVHFHDQGEGASLTHLRICKKLNIKTLLTYHSPGQSCMQRALTYAGKAPCDGRIDRERCTSCRYQLRGFSKTTSDIFAKVKLPFDSDGRFLQRNSTDLFYDSWDEFYGSVDAIQVHAHWVEEMLIGNGVDAQKIRFVEMGGHSSLPFQNKSDNARDPLKLVFVGRCTDIKGVHLLINAVKRISSDHNLEVHFFGPSWNDDYGKKLQEKINEDRRFKKPELISPDRIVNKLQDMDVCIIPSLWPETGPFTVFDAFAAGLPIIGTNHAGIAERVEHEKTGLLFQWDDAGDLKRCIERFLFDEKLLFIMRQNIVSNRTFEDMSTDFINLYKEMITAKRQNK